MPPAGNVMHLLSHDGRFSRLVQLLRKANLIDELADLGPLTFFAPTNEVFCFDCQTWMVLNLKQKLRQYPAIYTNYQTAQFETRKI